MSDNKKRSENSNVLTEFRELMKKYNINTFCFFGQEAEYSNEYSDEYFATYDIANYVMMRIIRDILFEYQDFQPTRNVIISLALKYANRLMSSCQRNSANEWIESKKMKASKK